MAALFLAFDELKRFDDFAEGMGVAGVKGAEGVGQDALVFAGESLANELFELGHVQIEHFGQQTEREDVFPFVLGRAANGFNGQPRDRHSQVMVIFLGFGLWFDMVRIIKDDAAFFQRTEMVVV